jgi:hypothetical protein
LYQFLTVREKKQKKYDDGEDVRQPTIQKRNVIDCALYMGG